MPNLYDRTGNNPTKEFILVDAKRCETVRQQ